MAEQSLVTDSDLVNIPRLLGHSTSQKDAYVTALGYLNRFLGSGGKFPRFLDLTNDHVEGDNLLDLIEDLAGWFAREQIFTKQKTWLQTDSKAVSLGLMKELFRHKFSNHELWKKEESSWWTDLRRNFKRACERSRMNDDNVANERKTEPLYRDISTKHHSGLLRAKYHGLEPVDARLVTMAMIRRGDYKSLLEFNISRLAVARGGEHRSLRWDEGTWDWFFDAPDFDWKIPKQLDRQPMLFFHDVELFCLDVFLSFALFGMFGGFLRPPTVPEARRAYVFYYLHDIKKESVAERMTNCIRATITDANRRKAFTSRSMRKGTSTELAVHPDVTIEERYCRGGWTGSNHLPNAEGYVEATPSLNAPGGLAIAGYEHCHEHAYPPQLGSLGPSVTEDMIGRLLDTFFPNDIPQLQVGGRLRPLIQGAAAAMLRHYKALVNEMGFENLFVKKIHDLARKANIEDHSIQGSGKGPQYLALLNTWSERISNEFNKRNLERVRKDANVEQQLYAITKELREVRNALEDYKQDTKRRFDMEYQDKKALFEENARLVKENEFLRRKLSESPPRRSPPRQRGEVVLTPLDDIGSASVSTGVGAVNDEGTDDEVEPPAMKKQRALEQVLDASAGPSTKIGGISASDALLCLWEQGHFKALCKKLSQDQHDSAPRSCLFDSNSPYFLPVHPAFRMSSEDNKYLDGMKIVALSIADQDWKKIIEGKMTEQEHHHMFAVINNKAKLMTRELEIECGKVDPQQTTNRIKPTMATLGLRFQAIRNHFKSTKVKSFEETEQWVLFKLGEQTRQLQQPIDRFFARREVT